MNAMLPSRRFSARMLLVSGLLLITVVCTNGCRSPAPFWRKPAPPALSRYGGDSFTRQEPADAKVVLRSGMEVQWGIQSSDTQPGIVRTGKALVGPDGTMMMGPYGIYKVAGLTLEQAGNVAEQQIAPFVKQPRVILSVVGNPPPIAAAEEIVWKRSNYSGAALAQHLEPSPPMTHPQPLPKDVPAAPINPSPPHEVVAPPVGVHPQPVAAKRIGHRRQPPLPAVLPHGPSELHPVLQPSYIIRPPDVLLITSEKGLIVGLDKFNVPIPKQPIQGQHLVRPDGTVSLGIYGSVLVAGKTLEQAREAIARAIQSHPDLKLTYEEVLKGVTVDVLVYNSSVYYVITDVVGEGDKVYRFPVTGHETVLDAISNISTLNVPSLAKRVWVARRNPGTGAPDVYPVDWKGVSQMGAMNTNWQLMPGDRVYVQADPVRRFNNNLGKILEPIERVLGATLLGGQTVNTIRSGTSGIR